MKYLILICAFCMPGIQSRAQWAPQPKRVVPPNNKTKPINKKKKVEEPVHMKNVVFVEGLGVGLAFSLNYQRNFYLSRRWDLATRAAINPFLYDYYSSPGYESKIISPMGALLFQSICKLKKGGELIFGMGMSGRIAHNYQTGYNNEVIVTRNFRKIGIAEFGYGQRFGKHLYSGVSVYAFVANKPLQVMGFAGLKVGYRFGKKKEY